MAGLVVAGAAAALPLAADSTGAGAPADTSAAADSAAAEPAVPPYAPNPAVGALADFRLGWSVDVERNPLGEPGDPIVPAGVSTLGDLLRLAPETRMRQLSWGPTAETFGLQGAGSGRTDLLLDGVSLGVPGTDGARTNEVFLSEIADWSLVRGGAGALVGPAGVSGAVFATPRFPVPDEMLSRAVGEEGVDGYQRASFQVSRRLGADGSFFVGTESRRIDGYFPGTQQTDRVLAGTVRGRLPGSLEGGFTYRRVDLDGRSGGTDDLPVYPVVARRRELAAMLFRPAGSDSAARGTLLELRLLREELENQGGESALTREVMSPQARLTLDLPDWLGARWVARSEASRWRVETWEAARLERFWRGAAALRGSRPLGDDARLAGTVRADVEQGRRRAWHARLEGEWGRGPLGVFAVGSRNERPPPRDALGAASEVYWGGEAGLLLRGGGVELRAVGFGWSIHELRAEPSFAEVRWRLAALGAPLGTGEILGGTLGLRTDFLRPPVIGALGEIAVRTSFTRQRAELAHTGERLPGRARTTWTGEGALQRRFFRDELLARVRGRLTHYGDRVNAAGAPVIDAWLTDVLLEAEIGDAIFFFRLHDMLERADEIEPGIRFPGFSRTYGLSWRFWG